MQDQEKKIRVHLDEKLRDAWESLLDSHDGRMIVHDLLTRTCGIYQGTFTGSNQGIWLEGRRSVGLDILKEYVITHQGAPHGLMMAEADEREKSIMAAMEADKGDADAD